MLAEFGDRHFRVGAVRGAQGGHLAADGRHSGNDFRFDAVAHQAGVVLLGRGLDNRHDLVLVWLAADDGGAVRLDDADLFRGDFLHGVGEFPDGHGGEHFEEAHLRLAQLVHFHVHDGDEVLDLVPCVDEIVV